MGCGGCGGVVGKVAQGAKGIGKAALRLDRATQSVIDLRRAVCRECPHAKRVMHKGSLRVATCDECGCYLPAKTVLNAEVCPLGKW